jgi:SAM-dependent methyltransferase
MTTPSLKAKLEALIIESLNVQYMSESSRDSLRTDNHYQTVRLGDTPSRGIRTTRDSILDRINFQGRRVLDLGCNLGELSRGARARGAALVDGFEYDPYFVEIGNVINAYNDITRVSLYQRDITKPSIYDEHYDIVLAFSVFVYLEDIVDTIAGIADLALVLETHKLEDNLESHYMAKLLPHLPHYVVLGDTEWGTSYDENEKRTVIVFCKEESGLALALR